VVVVGTFVWRQVVVVISLQPPLKKQGKKLPKKLKEKQNIEHNTTKTYITP
jgi:hypothetical protein